MRINIVKYYKLGPLIANRCGIILIVLVCQQRIWGSSPHFVGYHSSRILLWISVKELAPGKAGWFQHQWLLVPHIAVCSSFMKSICTIGGAVSHFRRKHTAETPGGEIYQYCLCILQLDAYSLGGIIPLRPVTPQGPEAYGPT